MTVSVDVYIDSYPLTTKSIMAGLQCQVVMQVGWNYRFQHKEVIPEDTTTWVLGIKET